TGQPMTCVLASDRLSAYFSEKDAELALDAYEPGSKHIPYKIIDRCKGSDLVGMTYEQLLPWIQPESGAFRVISGDFVTTEDGTGIVHIAPTFGADDDRVAKAFQVPALLLIDKDDAVRPMVDPTGKFYRIEDLQPDFVQKQVDVAPYSEFAGRFVKNAFDPNLTESDPTLDVDICVLLKQQNRVFRIEKHVHNYPHCWRTDKPVLYYPLDSWFIRTTACKERMMELNDTIQWKPSSTGTGRFGKWLENLQDWNLSRSRYWGTPLPIWRSEDGSELRCIGSVEELYEAIEASVKAGFMSVNPISTFKPGLYTKENYEQIDLHRPFVDEVILVSPSGKPMRREADLIDVWFDSGAMPYAQLHYPFENREKVDSGSAFPADFIAEGVDQTRGWFFTLHAIATMAFDSVAFKNVVSNGLVLDKNGNKMSKRLGNAVDPFITIDQYGSDPLRWYMITNASPWDNLKFDAEGIEEVKRKFFGTLYNTYSFFALYANVDGFRYEEPSIPVNERPEIDRWILSQLNSLIREVDQSYSNYEPTRAGRAISDFVTENVSNWYVRLNRKRFWGGEQNDDKRAAYQTLYECLETVARLMAPIAPFYADKLFVDLNAVTGKDASISVHLADFPVCNEACIDASLEHRMQLAQQLSSMVLALRRKVGIKVRQPLATMMIPAMDVQQRQAIEAVSLLIRNEVNVKKLEFMTEVAGILVKRIKPDFKKLGPKCGKAMKEVANQLTSLDQIAIAAFEKEGFVELDAQGNRIRVEMTDVEIYSEDIPGWLVANEGRLTVALDVTVTDALRLEGLARELVNRIQNIRKQNGYDITDKIRVQLSGAAILQEVVAEWKSYMCTQTLAQDIQLVENLDDRNRIDVDGMNLYVQVEKI
ncbi:MAG: isoleucine--tRNA ligase, partial [Bacteroidales bacterium]|nr:isoleucine--tRNA ligase [Bacteroidales bacterium]